MKKKNTLSVKPLRRYNTPVYPSYLDKNPIEHPDTLPYPFTYKALQVLAAAGILVGASCSPTKQVSDNSPHAQPELVTQDSSVVETESTVQQQDSLFNPFSFKRLSVPFMTAMFGTGMPERLKSNEARTVINRVFQEEGINLEENYFYKKDSLRVILDGFDADLNIGYVWVDWSKMGDGMVINSLYPTSYHEIMEQCFLNYSTDANFISGLESLLELRVTSDEENISLFQERLETAKKIETDEEKMQTLKEIYLDSEVYNYKKRSKFFQHITLQSSFQEKKDAYIKSLLRSKAGVGEATIVEIFDAILQLEDEQDKAKQYDNLALFLRIHRSNKREKNENSRTQQILNLQSKEKMAEQIQEFSNDYLDKKLSLQEAKYLENIHKTDEDFVAPISMRDYQFSYDYMRSRLTTEEKEQLRKIRETSTEEEYRELSLKIIKVAEKRNPKDEALKNLETQVRQYIRWAKQQSGN